MDKDYKAEPYYKNPRMPMLKYIPENIKTSLEVGCAYGNFSLLLQEKFDTECWGVEIVKDAADIASQKLNKVLNCDINDAMKQLPNNYFDCIIFNDVIEHLLDPYEVLKKIKVKLNKDGVIIASIPNVRFWNNIKALFFAGEWNYRDSGILDWTHLRFFTYKSIVKMFKETGYEIINIEGLRPKKSFSFCISNFLMLGRLSDAQYHQFACVVRQKTEEI